MENNQVLLNQRNKQLRDYYDILKEVAKSKFSLNIIEKKMFRPFSADKKNIYVNPKNDLKTKAHFLNGLLIKLTVGYIFGKKPDSIFDLRDMNYVSNNLYHRYAGDELIDETPANKEVADKVLINLDFAFKQAKENLFI